ncbi:DUF1109 domain-containing protein [Devosia ginsengisoli]|uniref:DUF1109 domain-containing protein n=1 Tax=Devosia ginsengisoli TaxID=400770 RepID=UPI0026EE6F7D|nr:DUF1109 domain-containing protein [Devosia ginsengisoli]MCR6672343.1 DUF1109 domain-containing protein [Devosia ginsengisoli]
MTDDLIARLSADLKPVRRMAMQRLLFGALLVSGVVAVIAMLALLGMRPDMEVATTTMMYWTKFGYTLAVTLLGLAATLVLARPDGHARWPWLAGFGLLDVLLVIAVVQLARADDMMPLIMGSSILRALTYIPVFALPVLLAALLALRRMAPANPTIAGFAAGIMAGGTGAWIYTFACMETGMMFLALWYTLGIVIVGGLGAVLGRFLLRW